MLHEEKVLRRCKKAYMFYHIQLPYNISLEALEIL